MQASAREEVAHALREHEAQLRSKTDELEAARRGETDGEREARLVAHTVQTQADTAARQHEQEVAFVRETLKHRSEDQKGALAALSERLEERHRDLDRGWSHEVEELKQEVAQQGLTLQARHKEEITSLRSAYNEAIDKLKSEMLTLIE